MVAIPTRYSERTNELPTSHVRAQPRSTLYSSFIFNWSQDCSNKTLENYLFWPFGVKVDSAVKTKVSLRIISLRNLCYDSRRVPQSYFKLDYHLLLSLPPSLSLWLSIYLSVSVCFSVFSSRDFSLHLCLYSLASLSISLSLFPLFPFAPSTKDC